MKNKRIILLSVLIVLLLGYLILRHFRNEEKLEPIFRIDPTKVTTIEVWNNEHNTALAKIEDVWKIVRPVQWDADTLRVNSLFRDVLSAKYATTAMSLSEDAVSRYNLEDDQALHLRITAGSKVVHVLFSNIGNPWDYFRYEGSSDVYQIKYKVVQDFVPDLYNWRSPVIVQYEEDELQAIHTKYSQNEYTLTRNGAIWTYKDARETFDITYSNVAMMKIVNILQNFNTYVFFDNQEEQYRELFNNPECTVLLTLTNGKKQELSFAKLDDQRYLMMVDGDKRVFFAVSFDAAFRFMRHAEVFRRIQA